MAAVCQGGLHLGDLFLQDLDDAGEVIVLRVLQDLQNEVCALRQVPVEDLHRDLEEELISVVPVGIRNKRRVRIDAAGADRHLLVQGSIAVVLGIQGAEDRAEDRDVGEESCRDLREVKLEVYIVDTGGKDRVPDDKRSLLGELFAGASVHREDDVSG